MVTRKQSRHRFSSSFRNYDTVFKSKTAAASVWQSALIIDRKNPYEQEACSMPFFYAYTFTEMRNGF